MDLDEPVDQDGAHFFVDVSLPRHVRGRHARLDLLLSKVGVHVVDVVRACLGILRIPGVHVVRLAVGLQWFFAGGERCRRLRFTIVRDVLREHGLTKQTSWTKDIPGKLGGALSTLPSARKSSVSPSARSKSCSCPLNDDFF